MCGLSGVIGNTLNSTDVRNIKKFTERIQNRGPDGTNVLSHLDDGFIVGHTRLAIIDISTRADQPFVDQSGSVFLIFNGEIYNYLELKDELEAIGFGFTTKSDTEVILNSYLAYGKEAFGKLRGMFAICLIDVSKDQFFLVRDRFGIKPLYYATFNNRLFFCSSQRVMADVLGLGVLDVSATKKFRFQGFILGPETVNLSIKSLESGAILSGSLHFEEANLVREYFSYKSTYVKKLATHRKLDFRNRLDKLGESILHTVEKHLISDAPLGIFLSGGIDSSILLASINLLGRRSDVLPISIGFESQTGLENETINAHQLCDQLGFDLEKKIYGRDEVVNLIDQIVAAMDQPTFDGINTWLASKFASECGLKVVLSGLGGDEIFCGYPSFKRIPVMMKYRWLLSLLLPIATGYPGRRLLDLFGINSNKLPLLKSCDFSVGQLYVILRSVVESREDNIGFKKFLLETCDQIDKRIPPDFHSESILTKISNFETFYYMENQLLRDSDWSSMAHSIELRVPFVDEELIQTTRFLYQDELYLNLKKDLARKYFKIPSYIWNRPKTGFGTPIKQWMDSCRKPLSRRINEEFGF